MAATRLPEMGVFSREEVATLRSLLSRLRNHSYNPTQRPPTFEFPQNDQIPVVYIAKTPEDGITGYTLVGGIPQLNYAECDIWKITTGGDLEAVTNFGKRVYSLYDFDIPGDTFIKIEKEAYGHWLAEWLDQDTGTGTGTGSGTTSCDDIFVQEIKYECEWLGTSSCGSLEGTAPAEGELNEYARFITIRVDESGCLQKETGEWIYTRTIACCDPSCACEEEQSGTGTPIEQDCCPDNPVPTNLTATVTNKTGNCVCLPDSGLLTWEEDNQVWRSPTFDTCADEGVCYFYLSCTAGVWRMDVASCYNPGTLVSESCDPFELVFDVDNAFQIACTGTFRITFTETP